MDKLLEVALNPFVGFLLLATLGGQFVKTHIFTIKRATTKGKLRFLWKWGRKTLAFHPVALGALVGYCWPGEVMEGYTGGEVTGMQYFAAAGICSTWGFDILKGIFKPLGVVIDPTTIPGMSVVPSSVPPPPEQSSNK